MAFHSLQFNKGNLQRLLTAIGTYVSSWSGGSTGLTPSTPTTGDVVLSGTLNVANGGTGSTTSTGTAASGVVLQTSPTINTSLAVAGTTNTTTLAVGGYSLTASNAQSMVTLNGRLNTSAAVHVVDYNVTVTSVGAGSTLLRLRGGLTATTVLTQIDTSGNIETNGYTLIGRSLNATAGGSTTGLKFLAASNFGVFVGSGSPTISVSRGSLYLRTDGLPYYNTDGATAWSPIAGVTQTKVTVFTSNGTWFVDPRTLAAQMECWGAGGGGGGTATGAAGVLAAGGGGGAGSYSRATSLKATVGTSQTVTIGALGTGGSAGNNAGIGGGDTSVGSICIGKGGSGGTGSAGTANVLITGGLGGVAGTGDATSTGMPGGNFITCATSTALTLSGAGGSTLVGGGGRGIGTASGANGEAATGRGAGGSGGVSLSGSGTFSGGNGSAGYVVITEYLAA